MSDINAMWCEAFNEALEKLYMREHFNPGRKDDDGKLRWDLLPWGPVREVVEVLTGALKDYEENSWQRVPGAIDRYFAALHRHLSAWWVDGEVTDTKSGRPHLAHVAANALFLVWLAQEKEA